MVRSVSDRYTSGVAAMDKELHSRQQPLRIIIEIRITSSRKEERKREKESKKRVAVEPEFFYELICIRTEEEGEGEEEKKKDGELKKEGQTVFYSWWCRLGAD
ncbi:hypothetical protein V1477_014998 [Vespula maculifrons]|uniref:Uncharacterized protein n=1 Tax=Vespula maculifrons TaxID=7453 RepID=A0ABD2BJ15_VESMC